VHDWHPNRRSISYKQEMSAACIPGAAHELTSLAQQREKLAKLSLAADLSRSQDLRLISGDIYDDGSRSIRLRDQRSSIRLLSSLGAKRALLGWLLMKVGRILCKAKVRVQTTASIS
jgi:hypothetical protein